MNDNRIRPPEVVTASSTGISWTISVLTYAATISCNMSLGNAFTLTATGDATINTTGGTAGQLVIFIITGDATGGRVITWGTGFYAGLDTLIVGASTIATLEFIYDGVSWKPTAPPYPSMPVYIWK